MKVPLAGPHQNQVSPKSEQESTPLSKPPPPPAAPPTGPLPPPPPIEQPFFLRFLPYIAGVIVFILIAFFAFRFVSGFFQGASGPVELTYWGLWEEQSVMDSVVADYERENPNVKITYQKQNIKQYRETLANRLLEKTGGPDIFRFHNTWVPMFRDFLAPVPGNVYTQVEFESTFYPVAKKDLVVGGNIMGIPLMIDTLALFINEDDFAAAGLAPPKTWKELQDAAVGTAQLTVRTSDGRIQKSGVALGTFDNVDHASDILALMIIQSGADFRKIDTSTSQDGKLLAGDVLDFYTKFGPKNFKVWDETLDPSTLAFAKGKLSMYFGYSWRIFEIRALNPALNFRIVPVPQLPQGPTKTFASYWVEGVSKNSPHQKEAFAFLKYLSKPETMQKLYAEESKLRSFGEPYSRVDMAGLLAGSPDVAPFLELAKDADSWYLVSYTYDNGLNDGMIRYLGNAVRSIYQQNMSPKSALETLVKGINEVALQYGL